MKKPNNFLILLVLLFTSVNMWSQVTGIKNIPGDYPTLAAAVATLNAQGVGIGGATINVPAGYTETLTAALQLNMSTNQSGLNRPLMIVKSGLGSNPLITAHTGTSTAVDGIFVLSGADFVTIDGIDLNDNASNTTNTMQMEWGYALLKNSGVDGCHNVTIKNCSITLQKSLGTSVYGVYAGNHNNVNTSALTVTNFAGTNSNNKFFNNSIQNCYNGIFIGGFNAGAPYDFYDQNNQVGTDGISTRRNQILNYGGLTTVAYGVNTIYQNNFKCFATYFNNSGGTNGTNDIYGLYCNTALNANVDIYNDTLNLVSAGTSHVMYPIYNNAGGTGAGNTVNIYNNVVSSINYSTATTGGFYGIYDGSTATYHNIYNNKFQNNTHNGTGTYAGIYYAGSSATLVKTVNIYNNLIDGNTKIGTSGTFYGIYESTSPHTINTYSNTINNNNCNASGNSCTFYGIYNNAAPPFEYIYNNTISNCTSGTGGLYGIQATTGGGTNKWLYQNSVNSCTATGGQVMGLYPNFGVVNYVYNNNIFNLANTGTNVASPNVTGIFYGASVNNVAYTYNNFISDLKAPNTSNAFAIAGMVLDGAAGTSNHNVYNNSIYISATSTTALFGCTGIHVGNNPASFELKNNIVVNNSTPIGAGLVSAIRRTQTILAPYSALSSNNCLFAGTPTASNVIHTDGTNNHSTLQNFKDAVTPREQASFTGLPPFLNVASTPYDLHLNNTIATACESGGQPIAGNTQDFDGQTRNVNTPDVGADEFAGISNDVSMPNIIYTPLTNGAVVASRNLNNFAVIFDASGINVTAGTKPRLYYKKSSDANTFAGNTTADNGWKFTEATNNTSPFNFTINYALLTAPVSAGDVIQYFVVAQDLATTPNVGINSGSFTAQPSNVNLSSSELPLGSTINQYTIVGTNLSGTINVSSTDTYTSLTNAGGIFEAINSGVLTGNLTIGINGNLTTETGLHGLNQ